MLAAPRKELCRAKESGYAVDTTALYALVAGARRLPPVKALPETLAQRFPLAAGPTAEVHTEGAPRS